MGALIGAVHYVGLLHAKFCFLDNAESMSLFMIRFFGAEYIDGVMQFVIFLCERIKGYVGT